VRVGARALLPAVRASGLARIVPALRVVAGVGVALVLRVVVAGGVGETATSLPAAVMFAGTLLGVVAWGARARGTVLVPESAGSVGEGRGGARPGMAVDGGRRVRGNFLGAPTYTGTLLGVVGGVMLVVLAAGLPRTPLHVWPRPIGMMVVTWTAIVAVISVAEELVFRGVLFDAVARAGGVAVACVVCAVAFAVVHVPLYGWQALPLDVGVGVWLGGLRIVSGGVVAPAVAHTVADLGAWLLV
jgi:membrane protease YdiL (CAAX protease family)